tara:strand:+ start:218 stop:331 length:114 start_codon:yes stop_codon:yes gene_type:complete
MSCNLLIATEICGINKATALIVVKGPCEIKTPIIGTQ